MNPDHPHDKHLLKTRTGTVGVYRNGCVFWPDDGTQPIRNHVDRDFRRHSALYRQVTPLPADAELTGALLVPSNVFADIAFAKPGLDTIRPHS